MRISQIYKQFLNGYQFNDLSKINSKMMEFREPSEFIGNNETLQAIVEKYYFNKNKKKPSNVIEGFNKHVVLKR